MDDIFWLFRLVEFSSECRNVEESSRYGEEWFRASVGSRAARFGAEKIVLVGKRSRISFEGECLLRVTDSSIVDAFVVTGQPGCFRGLPVLF